MSPSRWAFLRRRIPLPVSVPLVAALLATCTGSESASPDETPIDGGTSDGAAGDAALPDAPGLEIGFSDIVADPYPDLTCVDTDAKTLDPTVDGGGCLCPSSKPHVVTACNPAVDCSHCGWGTCWADCVDCSGLGPVWNGGCTE